MTLRFNTRTALLALALLCDLPAMAQMPLHDGGSVELVEARTLATWEPRTFLESVAADADGTVYVANHEHGTLERVDTGGRITQVAKLPGQITGILRLGDGHTLATGRSPGGPETVYHIDASGRVEVFTTPTGARFLNGLARLDARTVLAADSSAATVWKLDLTTKTASPWLRHSLLGHRSAASIFPTNTGFPAANGLKRHGDAVYVSNSDRAAIIRIPLNADGTAGTPAVWAEQLLADDFAFDAAGNLFAPSHPLNTVVRVAPNGRRTTIGNGSIGTVGPTAVTVAPDGHSLLVVGNSLIPYEGKTGPARLLALTLAPAGAAKSAESIGTPATAVRVAQIASPTYYMVTAETVPQSDAARQREGQAYLRFLEQHLDRIAFGGQVFDSNDAVIQRLYMVQAPTADDALMLLSRSPYYVGGVYSKLQVRRLQGMLGGLLGGVAWSPR